jgi:hypothetical protein
MKPPVHRKLKLETETLKTLTPSTLAQIRGGFSHDPIAQSLASAGTCHRP